MVERYARHCAQQDACIGDMGYEALNMRYEGICRILVESNIHHPQAELHAHRWVFGCASPEGISSRAFIIVGLLWPSAPPKRLQMPNAKDTPLLRFPKQGGGLWLSRGPLLV